MTRLNECCLLFNWQGGTIHEVNKQFNTVLNTNIDVLNLSEYDFRLLIEFYKLMK